MQDIPGALVYVLIDLEVNPQVRNGDFLMQDIEAVEDLDSLLYLAEGNN
jgi:hypothetical protein